MGAAPRSSGKKRRVYVDDSQRRDVDDALGDDLAMAYNHRCVRSKSAQVLDRFRTAESFGLIHRNRVALRRRFYRGGRKLRFAAFGAIGLSDYLSHEMARGYDSLKRGDGEFGRTQ